MHTEEHTDIRSRFVLQHHRSGERRQPAHAEAGIAVFFKTVFDRVVAADADAVYNARRVLSERLSVVARIANGLQRSGCKKARKARHFSHDFVIQTVRVE